jgi:6-phosphogluconolactonase
MRAAAERVVDLAERAVGARGRLNWALAGGSTPRELYSLLASSEFEARIDWTRVHFFWADERCVSPDHEQSNYRMARLSLLDVVRPPAAHVHRMQGELAPALAAQAYEQRLEQCFGLSVGDGFPRFDLILLGMGADGHTASLFPGSAALEEKRRWVRDNQVPQLGAERLTFTLPVLNAAAHVLFLVAGADKAPRLRAVLAAAPTPDTSELLPAARVRPSSGELEWLVDAPAAALLPAAVLPESFRTSTQTTDRE